MNAGEGQTAPAITDHDSVSITFDFTREDAVQYQLAMWQQHPRAAAVRRQHRGWAWLHAATLLVCAPLFIRALTHGADNPDGIGMRLAVFGGVTAYAAWWLWEFRRRTRPTHLRAHAVRAAATEEWFAMYGPHRVTLSSSGVALECRGSRTDADWSHIRRVLTTGPVVLIEFASGNAQPIPVRCFGSAGAAQAFQRRADEWLASAQQGDAARILAYLRENDAPCPKCRYNLRGVSKPLCPECGLSLTRESSPTLLQMPQQQASLPRTT